MREKKSLQERGEIENSYLVKSCVENNFIFRIKFKEKYGCKLTANLPDIVSKYCKYCDKNNEIMDPELKIIYYLCKSK